MARSILTNTDFNKNEIQNVRVQNLASAPASPVDGQIYFDTTLDTLRYWNGTVWVDTDGSDIPDGTITSAKIANGTIINEDIAAGAAIVLSKLATDPLARTNHTGSQAASTISDFDTQVRTSRLDQMAAPTAAVSANSQKITNLADPTVDTDAANKRYVDLARQGIRLKDSVRVATIGNITLSGTQTIDGIGVVAGNRVLVKAQTTPADNGIYVVAAGAWARATDADSAAELTDGATVWINEGTANANSTWAQINTLTALTDAQSWVQQGSASSYTAGNGLTLTGSTFDVGAGTGISVGADAVAVDTAVVARKFTTTVGDGAATAIVVTHNLGNQWCTVQVFRNSAAFDQVECDIELTSANTTTLRFAVAPTSAQYRAVITG